MVIQLKKTKVKDVQWFHLFLACVLLTKFKFRVGKIDCNIKNVIAKLIFVLMQAIK